LGTSVLEHSPGSKAAEEIALLTKEVVECLSAKTAA
jgi:hypothetical protein